MVGHRRVERQRTLTGIQMGERADNSYPRVGDVLTRAGDGSGEGEGAASVGGVMLRRDRRLKEPSN